MLAWEVTTGVHCGRKTEIRDHPGMAFHGGQRHGLKWQLCPNSCDFSVPLRALSEQTAPSPAASRPCSGSACDLHQGPQRKSPLPPCCHQQVGGGGEGEESRPQAVASKARKQLIRPCSHRLLECSLPAKPSTQGRVCEIQKWARMGVVLPDQSPTSGHLDSRRKRLPASRLFLQNRRTSSYHNVPL